MGIGEGGVERSGGRKSAMCWRLNYKREVSERDGIIVAIAFGIMARGNIYFRTFHMLHIIAH